MLHSLENNVYTKFQLKFVTFFFFLPAAAGGVWGG